MSENECIQFEQPGHYRIRLSGRLDPSWSDRVAGMCIESVQTPEGLETILTGSLHDQSALCGVLDTLYNQHQTILSVERLEEAAEAKTDRAP